MLPSTAMTANEWSTTAAQAALRSWIIYQRSIRRRVLKSWGWKYGVWMGFGGQSEHTRLFERAWLRTVFPPYLSGTGLSTSIGLLCIRGGWYKRLSDHGAYDEVVDTDGELAVLGWQSGGEVVDGVLQGVGEEASRSSVRHSPRQPDAA